jgi:hypothetical protein
MTLDLYGFDGLDRRCVIPGQQIIFAGRCCVHPCLARAVTFHVGMAKLQAQRALYNLLEGLFLYLLEGARARNWDKPSPSC